MKKIHLFVNGRYVCSTNKYRTCKAAKNAVLDRGFIEWAGADPVRLERLEIQPTDKIQARFSK